MALSGLKEKTIGAFTAASLLGSAIMLPAAANAADDNRVDVASASVPGSEKRHMSEWGASQEMVDYQLKMSKAHHFALNNPRTLSVVFFEGPDAGDTPAQKWATLLSGAYENTYKKDAEPFWGDNGSQPSEVYFGHRGFDSDGVHYVEYYGPYNINEAVKALPIVAEGHEKAQRRLPVSYNALD